MTNANSKPLTTPQNDWLRGVTILDVSSLLPCPFAAFLLAKFGARVIKIESPNRPDPARTFGYVPPEPGSTSSAYRELNTIKKLVWLDLKNSKDREQFYELVRTADGLIEGYRPSVRERLGIEYERLEKLNPRLVYCSVSGYSADGPLAERAGHDMNFVARSGILDQTRDTNGNVVPLGFPIGDYLVGYAAALRMASALMASKLLGRGCHIETSLEEALFEVQMPFLREAIESREFPMAGETLVTGKYPCYRIYNLGDGALSVGALEPKFWEQFCEAIDHKELVKEQFATGLKRDAVVTTITATLKRRPFSHWRNVFTQFDCCVEPVLSVKEALSQLGV